MFKGEGVREMLRLEEPFIPRPGEVLDRIGRFRGCGEEIRGGVGKMEWREIKGGDVPRLMNTYVHA